MTTAGNKPLKLLYLAQILWEETDDEHGITMKEIQTLLQEKGIKVDRKTLYNDIALLKQFGMDILMEQMDRTFYYSGELSSQVQHLRMIQLKWCSVT